MDPLLILIVKCGCNSMWSSSPPPPQHTPHNNNNNLYGSVRVACGMNCVCILVSPKSVWSISCVYSTSQVVHVYDYDVAIRNLSGPLPDVTHWTILDLAQGDSRSRKQGRPGGSVGPWKMYLTSGASLSASSFHTASFLSFSHTLDQGRCNTTSTASHLDQK